MPSGTLIGREDDVQRLLDALREEPAIAVVGPVGVGKTAVLDELARRWQGPVARCSLEGLTSASEVRGRVAEALGLEDPSAVGPALRGAPERLLVLDAAETAILDPDLLGGPVVLGSRERPTSVVTLTLGPLGRAASRALYLERIRRITDWRPEGADLDALLDVLDGLPQAIELAAAHVRVLPPRAMADRLEGGLGLLDQALTVSWERLEPEARTALAAASRIRGELDLAAFEAVTGRGPRVLEALLDASMVQLIEPGRMRLLHAVRRFAASREGPGDPTRYVDWVLSSSESVADGHAIAAIAADLDAASELDPRARLRRAELRVEWGPLVDPGPCPDPDLAERWTVARAAILGRSGRHELALQVLDKAGESLPIETLRTLQWIHLDPARALAHLPRLEQALEGESGRWVAEACLAIAVVCGVVPDEGRARVWLERGRPHAAGHPELEARLLAYLGILSRQVSWGVAMAHLDCALELQERLGNRRRVAITRSWQAAAQLEQGPDPRADQLLDRAASAALAAGDPLLHVEILGQQVDRALELGDPDRAEALIARIRATEALPPLEEAQATRREGLILLARGRRRAAVERLDQALDALAPLGRKGLAATWRTFRDAAAGDPVVAWPDGLAGRVLRAAITDRAELARDGSSIRSASGEVTDLSAKPVLSRLAAAFAARGPNVDVTRTELVEATWPGEKMRADSADQRLHAAIRTLRKTGLPLETGRVDGELAYRLAADVDIGA